MSDREAGAATGAETPGYPPRMPWHLRARGLVLVALHWMEIERAREVVPPELTLVRFLPGRTIGGLFLAEYGPGSELQYNELIVSAATVWHRGRPAAWATHLFVDDKASVAGGRTLLGAPKHLAPFSWDDGEVTVGEPAAPICRVRYGRRLWLWRQRVSLAALHRDVREPTGSTASLHGNAIRGKWGLTRVEVEIPEASPLRRLGLGKPLLGVCGREVELVLGGAPFLPLRLLPISPVAAR